jgi:hypothetical protein
MDNPMTLIMNLGAVAAFALGAIFLIWRTSARRLPSRADVVLGYPPDQFPAHDVINQDALRALATTQSRLLAIYDGLPPGSDSAKRLHTFLIELRAIMDVAYQVALITRAYGQSPQLTRLAAEVQQIEAQLAQQMIHRLLSYEADAQEELLNGRFAALRELVREITPGAETHVPMLGG